jgi:hypothetical protein
VARTFPALRTLSLLGPKDPPVRLEPLGALSELRSVTCRGQLVADADRLPEHVAVSVPPTSRY